MVSLKPFPQFCLYLRYNVNHRMVIGKDILCYQEVITLSGFVKFKTAKTDVEKSNNLMSGNMINYVSPY